MLSGRVSFDTVSAHINSREFVSTAVSKLLYLMGEGATV